MAKAKTEITIDGVAYPVIKELEFNYVIQYGNDKRLFNKRKKRLVGTGYNDKKQKKDARYKHALEYVEYVITTATKSGRVTVKARNGKTVDIADTYTVVRERKGAGKTVELEEQYFIKTVGRGRYWNDRGI